MASKVFYNPKLNLEYYTIPKCGMTSIVRSLNLKSHDYFKVPDDRRIFTVIRNPIHRFLSGFLHCRKIYSTRTKRTDGGGIKIRKLEESFYHKDVVKSFELYLTEIENNGVFDGHNAPQMFWIDNLTSKKITVPRKIENVTDFILFENMDSGLKKLTGKNIKVLKLNPSNHKEKKILKTIIGNYKDRIIDIYKEDWELYNKLKNG